MICYAVPFWLILLCALLYIIGCLGTWAHAMEAKDFGWPLTPPEPKTEP